jgi:A/G-specific adenine glycosylase
MLQQTQVATVIPYFERFILRFPTVRHLATAPLQDVLKAWEGLGYYSRARNLHLAAQVVMRELGGKLPETAEALRRLPGVGLYSSAAIASIAFREPVPAVDGNVLRVCCRLWGLRGNDSAHKTAALIRTRLTPLMRAANPSHLNQAIMELGALVCKPRSPRCGACPVRRWCAALAAGLTHEIPAAVSRPRLPHHRIGVGIVWKRGRILIAKRRSEQMLGGLWEFPGGKHKTGESLEATVLREIREETGLRVRVNKAYCTVKHAYSHLRVTITAFRCEWLGGRALPRAAAEVKWILPEALNQFPFPRANRRIADAILEERSA